MSRPARRAPPVRKGRLVQQVTPAPREYKALLVHRAPQAQVFRTAGQPDRYWLKRRRPIRTRSG